MEYRELKKEELPRLREVDRTEVVDRVYHYEEGKIVLKDEHYEIPYDWWVKHYRRKGVAIHLMGIVKDKAKEMGAKRLYISATPSENTVNFYLNRGCRVTNEVDKKLLELEPDDIHMELDI
jgi:GNAT superfamily N-acetyltransferase